MEPRCGVHNVVYTQFCSHAECRKLLCPECVGLHKSHDLLGMTGLSSIAKDEIKIIKGKLLILQEDKNVAFDMSSIPAEKFEDHIAKIRKEVKAFEKLIYENIEKYYEKITAILKANTSSILGSKKEELELLEDGLNKAKTIDAVYKAFRKIQTVDESIKNKKATTFDALPKKIEFPEPVELLKIAEIIKQAEKSIQEIGTEKSKKDLKDSRALSTSKELYTKSQNNFLRASYSKKKGVPSEVVASLTIHQSVMEEEEGVVIEEGIKEEEQNAQERLRRYLSERPEAQAKWEEAALNYEWLVTVISVMACGRVDKTGKIELKRLLLAFCVGRCEVTMDDIVEVSKLLNCFEPNSNTLIYYNDLLRPIKLVLTTPVFQEQPTEAEPVEGTKGTEEKKKSSEGKTDRKEILEEKQDISEDKATLEMELELPDLPDNWGEGEFSLVINRCHNCMSHKSKSRHSEEKFVNAFNTIGGELKKVFPNVNLIGNYEKISYIEGFDVYIRGLGPTGQLDETGRLFLFSRASEKRLPSPQEIVDKVILLCFTYGDSHKMAHAQNMFMKENSKLIPRPYKMCDKYPVPMLKGASKSRQTFS